VPFFVESPWNADPPELDPILQSPNLSDLIQSQSRRSLWRYLTPPPHRFVKVKVTLRLTVSQSVSLGVEPHLGLMTRYLLLFDSYGIVIVGRPL
jgi:hypothetical protein